MNQKTLIVLLFLFFLAVGFLFWKRYRQHPIAPKDGQWWAIQGATVYTMGSKKPILNGTVLFRGDTIVEVGQNLDLPTQTHVISGAGKILTPGIVLAGTRLGVLDISLEMSTHNGNFYSNQPERPGFQVFQGFDFNSSLIPVARIEGITAVQVEPFGGRVSGQSALVHLYGQPERLVIRSSLAIHATIHLGQSASSWRWLGDLVEQARFFNTFRAQYERRQHQKLRYPRTDLEAMSRVIQREIPLVLHVNKAADILTALRFAKKQSIRLVLSGVQEGWQVASQIAQAKIPVLLGLPYNLPSQFDRLGSRYDNAARLHHAGVLFAFSAQGDAHNLRTMRYEAGIAVAWGLPAYTALQALTRNFYRIFGLQERYGLLKSGYKANMVLWGGDPLELSTRALRVWIHGQDVPMISRQTLLRDRYKDLKTVFHTP